MKIFLKEEHITNVKERTVRKKEFFLVRNNELLSVGDEFDSVFETLDDEDGKPVDTLEEMSFEAHFFIEKEDDDVLLKIETEHFVKEEKLIRTVSFNSQDDLNKYQSLIEASIDEDSLIKNKYLNFLVEDLIVPVTEKMEKVYKELS